MVMMFHGSYENFPVNLRLRGRGTPYHEDWSCLSHYEALHLHKPVWALSHKDAVFMCNNIDDIDLCGGATDIVVLLEPLGEVTHHDLNWSGKISLLLDSGADVHSSEVKELVMNYWCGIPTEDPLWEFLTDEAKVIACAPYEDADVLMDFMDEESGMDFL